MSKHKLDEAIKHCLEVAENNEQFASGKWIGSEGEANRQECEQCAADHRQLAEWLMELKEAKRLLKAAVEDFSNMYDHIFDCDGMCDTCSIHGNRDTCDKWVHADEALKLIGEDVNGI